MLSAAEIPVALNKYPEFFTTRRKSGFSKMRSKS
jgi:hypothetical protein